MYFYQDKNNSKEGPVTLKELKKHITRDTLIWSNGMAEWERASDVNELKEHFSLTPPALPSELIKASEKAANELSFVMKVVGVGLLVGIIIALIYFVIESSTANNGEVWNKYDNDSRNASQTTGDVLEIREGNFKNAMKSQIPMIIIFSVLGIVIIYYVNKGLKWINRNKTH
jgi:hypothetical protein